MLNKKYRKITLATSLILTIGLTSCANNNDNGNETNNNANVNMQNYQKADTGEKTNDGVDVDKVSDFFTRFFNISAENGKNYEKNNKEIDKILKETLDQKLYEKVSKNGINSSIVSLIEDDETKNELSDKIIKLGKIDEIYDFRAVEPDFKLSFVLGILATKPVAVNNAEKIYTTVDKNAITKTNEKDFYEVKGSGITLHNDDQETKLSSIDKYVIIKEGSEAKSDYLISANVAINSIVGSLVGEPDKNTVPGN